MWYPARGGLVVQMVSIFWYQNGSFNVSVINLFILLFAAMDSFALSRNFRTHRRDGSPQSLLSSPNTKWRKMKFVKMLSLEQYCTRALSSCHSIISFTPYMLIENSRAGHAVTFFWQPRHAPYGLSHLGPHFRISESHHGVRATASLHHLLSNALLRVCAKSDKDCEKLRNFTSLSHLNVIFCVKCLFWCCENSRHSPMRLYFYIRAITPWATFWGMRPWRGGAKTWRERPQVCTMPRFVTLSPMQLKMARPTSHRRIIRAKTNCRMRPQITWRHTTYPAHQQAETKWRIRIFRMIPLFI